MDKKKIPYGISNFEELIEKDYYYIDKTEFIEKLEGFANYQFFIRPRRFGKSLFLSMMESYYDINKKDKFKDTFGSLYIGKNPTEERNSYLVLRLDFSNMETNDTEEKFIKSFDFSVIVAINNFIKKYKDILLIDELPKEASSAVMALHYIIGQVSLINKKLFLLIDEYDNFANQLISSNNNSFYRALISGEGYVKTFYKTIKLGTTSCISRVFITGVSPIMLDDLTSGFNITENLTLAEQLNTMLGFKEEQIRDILNYYNISDFMGIDTVIEDMQKYYNGYRFSSGESETVYNPDMALYFLKELMRCRCYPENMIDDNVKTDYQRLNQLSLKFNDSGILQEIIENEEITSHLVSRFNLEEMYSSEDNFVSLLYYLGMLTIKSVNRKAYTFAVPNYVIKKIYWDYFIKTFQRKNQISLNVNSLSNAVEEMASKGEIKLFIDYLKDKLELLSNRDLQRFDEKYIKLLITTVLDFEGSYIIGNEFEVRSGYVDIFLMKNRAYENSIKYEWLIELKYIKEENRKNLDTIKQDGMKQLHMYSVDKKLQKAFDFKRIKKVLIIVVGKNDIVVEYI